MTSTTHAANAGGDTATTDTPRLDTLFADWSRLERARGRSDEQVVADNAVQDEIERQMTAIPAADIRGVALKLSVFNGSYYDGESGTLLASAISDLDCIAARHAGIGPVPVTPRRLVDGLEDLQAKLDTYSAAAAIIGEMMGGGSGSLGDCRLFYAAHHTLASLHRDVTDLVELAVTAYRGTDGGAA
jgi:hypothetical protein